VHDFEVWLSRPAWSDCAGRWCLQALRHTAQEGEPFFQTECPPPTCPRDTRRRGLSSPEAFRTDLAVGRRARPTCCGESTSDAWTSTLAVRDKTTSTIPDELRIDLRTHARTDFASRERARQWRSRGACRTSIHRLSPRTSGSRRHPHLGDASSEVGFTEVRPLRVAWGRYVFSSVKVPTSRPLRGGRKMRHGRLHRLQSERTANCTVAASAYSGAPDARSASLCQGRVDKMYGHRAGRLHDGDGAKALQEARRPLRKRSRRSVASPGSDAGAGRPAPSATDSGDGRAWPPQVPQRPGASRRA